MRYAIVAAFVVSLFAGHAAGQVTPDKCRKSNGDDELLAACFEAGVFDACRDQPAGSAANVECVVMRKQVAAHRIARATREIAKRSRDAGVVKRDFVDEHGVTPAHDYGKEANRLWERYVTEHCSLLNELESVDLQSGEIAGFCEARLMEERAEQLEAILKGMIPVEQ